MDSIVGTPDLNSDTRISTPEPHSGQESIGQARPSGGTPADPHAPAAPDILVYASGVRPGQQSQPDLIANLLCAEIDKRAGDSSAAFTVERVPTEPDNYYRIQRTTDAGTKPVVDLYVLELFNTSDATSISALRRVTSLGLTVVAGFWILFIGGIFRRGSRAKSPSHKWQLAYSLIALGTMVVYLAVLVWALVQAIVQQVSGQAPTVSFPQWFVLIGAFIGALYPNLRANLADAAARYQEMMQYIWTSGLRNAAAGKLRALVNRINKRDHVDRIHLVGFSFGSLAILDTLLSQSSKVPAPLKNVHSMTTIGCPFDMVRTLRPTYADGRSLALDPTPEWINIYSPIDALGSNFVDNPRHFKRLRKGGGAAAQDGIAVDKWPDCTPTHNDTWNSDIKLNPINFLMLRSLTSHLTYWSTDIESDSAWGIATQRLLQGRPALI